MQLMVAGGCFTLKILTYSGLDMKCREFHTLSHASDNNGVSCTPDQPSVNILATDSVSFPTPGTEKSVFFPDFFAHGTGINILYWAKMARSVENLGFYIP